MELKLYQAKVNGQLLECIFVRESNIDNNHTYNTTILVNGSFISEENHRKIDSHERKIIELLKKEIDSERLIIASYSNCKRIENADDLIKNHKRKIEIYGDFIKYIKTQNQSYNFRNIAFGLNQCSNVLV